MDLKQRRQPGHRKPSRKAYGAMTVRTSLVALAGLIPTLILALSAPPSGAVAPASSGAATSYSSSKIDDTAIGASPNRVSYRGFASEVRISDFHRSDHISGTPGSSVTIHWKGVRLSIQARTAPSFGIGFISTDGSGRVSVSWYTRGSNYQRTVYTTPMLPMGVHATTIVVSGKHVTKSSGRAITLDSFVVTTVAAPPAKAPVVEILLENLSYGTVIGNRSMPYLNRTLVPHSLLLTHYDAVDHPSLPNYDALTSGQVERCGDACPTDSFSQSNIFNELNRAGDSFASYEESMPSACDLGSSYPYAPKHNPEVYYTDVAGSVCARTDLPLRSVSFARLPMFSFVTPNLINDIHDGTSAQGDAWLSTYVPRFQTAGATVIVVFDESVTSDTAGGGGHIFADISGAHVTAGTNGASYDHYGLLHGLLNYFNLGCLGASCNATAVSIP